MDDLATACIYVIEKVNARDLAKNNISHINVGYGDEISIINLANMIKKIVGFNGELDFDTSKPDGTLKKKLDCSRLKDMGWEPSIKLEDGIKTTYKHYINSLNL